MRETRGGHVLASESSRSPAGSFSLLVHAPFAQVTAAIPERGIVVLGRAQECDVRIDDDRLSSRHAEIRADQRGLYFVDLASKNGSFLREARLAPNAPVPVALGDAIAVGGSVVRIRHAAGALFKPRVQLDALRFRERLDEECAAARCGGEPFATMRVSAIPEGRAESTTVDARFAFMSAKFLLLADVLCERAANDYVALLLAVTSREVDSFAQDLGRSLGKSGVNAELRVAVFGRDGRTAEELVGVLVPAPRLSEREQIARALAKAGGNQVAAAKHLKLSRSTLIRRIEEYGIARPRKR
jgi:hypothetical protein